MAAYHRPPIASCTFLQSGNLAYYLPVEEGSVTLDALTLTIAYEIADFADTNHPHIQLIEHSTAFCVQHIVNHLPRPEQPQQAPSDRDRRARARSQSLDLSWPPSWAIDRSTFRDALRRFDTATRELRQRAPRIATAASVTYHY